MEISKPIFKKYIFVCENTRPEGACCSPRGELLRGVLKKKVEELGLSSEIRVSRSGCLDVCADGPNILLMPDNLWFKKVEMKDIPTILEKALESSLET